MRDLFSLVVLSGLLSFSNHNSCEYLGITDGTTTGGLIVIILIRLKERIGHRASSFVMLKAVVLIWMSFTLGKESCGLSGVTNHEAVLGTIFVQKLK